VVKIEGVYQGQKHCEISHVNSGATLQTDAPKDNNGLGQSFSPTDLVGVALGSCMMTVMAIWAEQNNVSLQGSRFSVVKEMKANPRRVGRLTVQFVLPAKLEQNVRTRLEEIARTCPVKYSIHPEIELPIEFSYSLD